MKTRNVRFRQWLKYMKYLDGLRAGRLKVPPGWGMQFFRERNR